MVRDKGSIAQPHDSHSVSGSSDSQIICGRGVGGHAGGGNAALGRQASLALCHVEWQPAGDAGTEHGKRGGAQKAPPGGRARAHHEAAGVPGVCQGDGRAQDALACPQGVLP